MEILGGFRPEEWLLHRGKGTLALLPLRPVDSDIIAATNLAHLAAN